MKFIRNLLRLTLYISILLAALACESGADKNNALDPSPAVAVEVITVLRGDIDATYHGTAILVAAKEALVVAKVNGVVEKILVEEGDQVKAEQKLAQLDDERLKLERDRAKAKLNQLSADFKRSKSMFKKKLVSVENHEKLRFGLASQRAEYQLAQLRLSESAIQAPFAGIVSERLIKVGNMVPVNTPAFRITQLDHLQAIVHVPEREISKLAVEQPAVVSVDAWQGEWFNGAVERINPLVDAKTGTVRVTLKMLDNTGRLRPGMFGRLRIRYENHPNALLIPNNAVLTEDNEQAVFVVVSTGESEPSIAERRVVTTGFSDKGYLEILTGLVETDQIVVTGHTTLKSGVSVEVVNLPVLMPVSPQVIGK